jgi:ABC-type multidrug transport system fused ATPase/permease subunit
MTSNTPDRFKLPGNPLRLASYLKKYSRYFWIQTAGGIVYNTVIVAGPILLGKMLDAAGSLENNGVTSERVRDLLLLVVGFVLVTIFFQYGRYVKRWYLRVMTNRIASDMRSGLLSRVLRYPMSKIERESVGDLMSRTVGDVDQITNTLQQIINEGWDTGLLMISYFAVLMWYDWHITLLASIPIPFAIFLAELVRHPVYRFSLNSRKAASVVTSHVQRTLGGLSILRLFGRENIEADRLKSYCRDQMKWDIRTSLLQNAMMPIYAALASLGIIGVVILGGSKVINGAWTVGTFVAYLSMFVLMAARTQVAARIFNQFHAAAASWDRIKVKLGEPEDENEGVGITGSVPRTGEGATSKLPLIQVRNLSFHYPGSDREVLHGISFAVNRGDFIGITGPVGSGKSALAMALTGLYPYAGEILIGGRELSTLSSAERSETLAYAGEDAFLFSASIRQNIMFREVADSQGAPERLDVVVHIAALSDDIVLFREGLDTLVGERGVRLSGGQRQRVSLARAIYSGNPILVLDDPFSAVDIGTEQRLIERIRPSLKGYTILVFSHRLASFTEANQVLVLEKGKVTEQGNHQKLMAAAGIYQKIYSAQTWLESEKSG